MAVQTVAMRASDAEREGVVAELREHFAQGRLSSEEFEERVARAYGARTRDQLAPLLVDLPNERRQRRERRRHNVGAWSRWFVVNLVCWAIWAADFVATPGHHVYPWPVWVTVPWGLMLMRGMHHHHHRRAWHHLQSRL